MVPPGEAIDAWPPGASVTVLATPFVVTVMGCPTTSEAGVQACANVAPGNAATVISPIAIRATNRFSITLLASSSERRLNRMPSGGAVGSIVIVVHREENPDAHSDSEQCEPQRIEPATSGLNRRRRRRHGLGGLNRRRRRIDHREDTSARGLRGRGSSGGAAHRGSRRTIAHGGQDCPRINLLSRSR